MLSQALQWCPGKLKCENPCLAARPSWCLDFTSLRLLSSDQQIKVDLLCSHFKNQYFTHFCNWWQSQKCPVTDVIWIWGAGQSLLLFHPPAWPVAFRPVQVSTCLPYHLLPSAETQVIKPKGCLPAVQNQERCFSPWLHIQVSQGAFKNPNAMVTPQLLDSLGMGCRHQ